MDLLKNPRCYTDVCVEGYWFHYDHCGTSVYRLRGSDPQEFQLSKEPNTEEELFGMLKDIAQDIRS